MRWSATPASTAFDPGDGTMLGARFFPEARLNLAENLLVGTPDASDPAIVFQREDGQRRTLTWEQLGSRWPPRRRALRGHGRRPRRPGRGLDAQPPRDRRRVPRRRTRSARSSRSTSARLRHGRRDRPLRPDRAVVLFAADGYTYGGKRFDCLERLAEIGAALPSRAPRSSSSGTCATTPTSPPCRAIARSPTSRRAHGDASLEYVRTSFDHPAAILYSSGTTGPPKCIVHRAGGLLLKHLSEQQLHCDVKAGDRVFYFTTCGWMMWNWLVSSLASKATIVLYDGNPMHPVTVGALRPRRPPRPDAARGVGEVPRRRGQGRPAAS